ncbi:MAG TPA: Crp/Fnr family transcriptional regulator [Flavobacteriaceae bacterium]|nr:Crp/Fnr family transcriptional regulator [Flavobacteriaceae bacterium]MCB9211874.1 Crp/Fnr family transcriptional regulator [Alteromonas sp.]HPF10032.1 Crp/Fnr family transcriptional regulator [Flavobacteriaceae bacterium]HQU21331.1 Crp/Fnr family transcriptional regulator [Flavobacteriaceae bacterium]HQU63885.1 Crp/Fnr family transcriptional regulator [Flavobacteriaceae bacterium]
MIQELTQSYGHLFENELLEEINQVGTFKELPEGFKLIEIGEYIKSMPLLISGAIKVLREDQDGDELLLYFLERGDTCAMTLSCCLGQTKSEIRAIAELDTKLVMVPIRKMEEWVGKYRTWRNFVFESYHNRLMEMLEAIDSIAFMKMDERLLKYLHDKVKVTSDIMVHTTHQEIAYELHTSRVVISRLLKNLEKLGKIKIHRNKIEVIDRH